MLHIVLVWQRQPSLKSERMITRFCSKNGADPLNSLFTLGAEHSKKLSDTERIFFWNRSVPGHNGYKNCARSFESGVNRRPIRYSFPGAPIIDQV